VNRSILTRRPLATDLQSVRCRGAFRTGKRTSAHRLECASTPWHPNVGSMWFRSTIAVRLAVIGAINVVIQDEVDVRHMKSHAWPITTRATKRECHTYWDEAPRHDTAQRAYKFLTRVLMLVSQYRNTTIKENGKSQRYGADRSESPKLFLSLRIVNPKGQHIA
jgi:hypothetical protein